MIRRITVLSVNDVYDIDQQQQWCGLPGLATLLKQERETSSNSLTTLNGDFLAGSMFASYWKGAHMIDLMNQLGFDAVVAGNHEFDFNAEVLRERIAESKFVWLASNIHEAGSAQIFDKMIAYQVREINNVRVGLFGVCTPDIFSLSHPGPTVAVSDVIAAAKRSVSALKAEGCTVIIALTHQMFDEDVLMVKHVSGIDLVLGGHEHHPICVMEGKTLILKAGCNANWLARIDIDVHTDFNVLSWRLIANSNIALDADTSAAVHKYTEQVADTLKTPLCVTLTEIDTRASTVRGGESAAGNFIADLIQSTFACDVVMVNCGTIRGNTLYAPQTALSRYDILREFPFSNSTVLVQATGAQLRTALEQGLRKAEQKIGFFPAIAGLRVTYSSALPPLHRLVTCNVVGADKSETALDPQSIYRLVVTNYMRNGGDGYDALPGCVELEHSHNRVPIEDLVLQHFVDSESIAPVVDGRLVDMALQPPATD